MLQVNLDELTVDVDEEGSGPAVVLVHGSAGDRRSWDEVRPRLASRFRVLSYSRRFHWPNPPAAGTDRYAMTTHVDDLVRVIETAAPGPVHLVGHSYGGFVSLLTAVRRPDLVGRLVVVEPPVIPLVLGEPPSPARVARLMVARPRLAAAIIRFGARGLTPARRAARAGDLDRAVEIFGRAVLGPTSFARLSVERREQAQLNVSAAELLGPLFDPLTAEQLGAVAAPTLLLSGADSPSIWPLLADELHRHLPHSTRQVIAGTSHDVPMSQPERFLGAVVPFLEELAPRRGVTGG